MNQHNPIDHNWECDAASSLQQVVERADTPQLLRDTLATTLSWQARNEITVARAMRAAGLAPQWNAALLALGATVTVDGPDGPRQIDLIELRQVRESAKPARLHIPARGLRWGYAQVARTPADEPIVAAVAAVALDGDTVRQARLALTGAWPETARLAAAVDQLLGGPLDETHIQAATAALEQEVTPKDDFLGSADYRRAMAVVLARRALEECR